jgi:hypothetical protein
LDDRSPFALATGRVIKRLDPLSAVRFRAARREAHKNAFSVGIRVDGKTRVAHGSLAMSRLAQALPLPRIALWLFKGLGLELLLGRALDWAMGRRARMTRVLGLDKPRAVPRPRPATRGRRLVGRVYTGFATACLLGLLVLGVSQALIENRVVPPWAKPKRPEWMNALVVYPRLFQGWSMFAPDPPREDGWMIVDGRTADGSKLDPTTGKEPNFSMDLPGGPDFSPQWGAFHMRIHEGRFRAYYNGVRDYILRTHELNERPHERMIAFDAWYLSRIVKPPGGQPGPARYRKLFSYGRVNDSGLPRGAVDQSVQNGQAQTNTRGEKPRPRRKTRTSLNATGPHPSSGAPEPRRPFPHSTHPRSLPSAVPTEPPQ